MAQQLYSPDVVARLFEFESVRSVERLAQDGVITPVVVKDENNRDVRRYDLIPTVQGYIRHLRKKIETRGVGEDVLIEAADADTRFKKAKADKMELELAELRAQMHRSEDVEAVVGDMISAIRAAVCSIPGYVAVDCAKAQTAEEAAKVVRESVNLVLENLMQYQYDPKIYAKLVRDREKWMNRNEDSEEAEIAPVQAAAQEKKTGQRAAKGKKTQDKTPSARKTGGFDMSVGKGKQDK